MKILKEFMSINNIGPATARKLYYTENIKSIEELENKKEQVLNKNQLLGLKYYKESKLKIPRSEMETHQYMLKKILANVLNDDENIVHLEEMLII